MKTNKKEAVVKLNPKWRLDEETIALVKEARVALGLQGACDVVSLWAKQWKEKSLEAEKRSAIPYVESVESVVVLGAGPKLVSGPLVIGNPPVVPVDIPRAERVETPYQIERRRKLEELRAKLEGATAVDEFRAAEAMSNKMAGEPLVLPFDVMVNGEKHRVIEFKGRRVLEWVGPTSTVMKKNLTPQEVVIYWKEREVKP